MREDLSVKVNIAMQSTFIGDVVFAVEELDEMKEHSRIALKRRNMSYSKVFLDDDICVLIVLIVNLAKNWCNDEGGKRFWVKILNDIFEDSSVSPNMLYDDFETILKRNNKVIFLSPKGKRMIREVLLYHSFAPKLSNRAFIDLIWSWYIDEEVMDEGNNPMFPQIVRHLQKKFSGNVDNLDSDTVFEGKTYMLRAAIKYGFMQDYKSSVELIKKTVGYIDDIWHNNQDPNDGYFAIETNKALNEILLTNHLKRETRKQQNRQEIVSDFEKLKTMSLYEFTEDKQINIFIPELRGIDEKFETAKLEILAGDKVIYNRNHYIVGRELKKRLKRIVVSFKGIVKEFKATFNLRIRLSFDGTMIFDSKERLYREFILFRKTREVRGDCRPDMYFLAHTLDANLSKMTNCVYSGIGSNHIVSLEPQEGQYISSVNKTVFFNSAKQNSHIVFLPQPIEHLSYVEEGNEFYVFSKICECTIYIDTSYDVNKIIVIHNDKTIKKLIDISNNYDSDSCKIEISLLGLANEGCHKLLLKNALDDKIIGSYSYIVIRSLNFTMSANYAFADVQTAISIAIGRDCICKSMLGRHEDDAVFDYMRGGIQVLLPTIKWQIDDQEWRRDLLSNRLWKSNGFLHSNSIISIENNSKCLVTVVDSRQCEIKQNINGKYLVGDYLLQNKSEQKNEIFLKINDKLHLVLTIYNKPSLVGDVTEGISYNEGQLHIDLIPYFVGEDNSKLRLSLHSDDKEYNFDATIKDEIHCDIKDGEYEISISVMNETVFDCEMIELGKYQVVLGNPDKFCFINETIELLSSKKESGKVKFENCKLINIEYSKEENGRSIYSALLSMPKNRTQQVEIEKVDERVLKIYFVRGEDIFPANIDDSIRQLTSQKVDNNRILPCKSCYYKVEK